MCESLLVTVPAENEADFKNLLDRVAPFDWEASQRIVLLGLQSEVGDKNFRDVVSHCQDHGIRSVLVPARVHCNEHQLREADYEVNVHTIQNLLHRDGLLRILRKYNLDWKGRLLKRLEHFSLGPITERDIDKWLWQFERLGNNRPIGEFLLQHLDVLSGSEREVALSSGSEFYGADLVLGINEEKLGKSWGTVSNVAGKGNPNAVMLPVNEAIEHVAKTRQSGTAVTLRLLEDGLFSGTEIQAILDSLRGTRPKGRSQKVPRLSDPSILSALPIDLSFGVVCDYGELCLREYARINSLPNIRVLVGDAARRIQVLSPASKASEGDSSDPSRFKTRLRARVVPYAFAEVRCWRDEELRKDARTFCEAIGRALWESFIKKKPGFDPDSWPNERIEACALGSC